MNESISKYDNIIDSRDVDARISDLSNMVEDDTIDEEEKEELGALLKLKEQAEGYASDWPYGCALINDDYFSEYAQDLAHDLGYAEEAGNWPYTCVDWEKAARELQHDYTSVEFNGQTFWVR